MKNPIGQNGDNLYDKYRNKVHHKNQRLIEERKDRIKTEITNKKIEEKWKDPKYRNVKSKINNTQEYAVRTLNYEKRCDRKADNQKKIK